MEQGTGHILETIKKRSGTLNTVVLIVTPVAFIVGGLFWYFNNIWKPTIVLVSADYVNNTAQLTVNGKPKTLYAGSVLNAGYGWGVRFSGKLFDTYDRIEIVKNDLAYQTISIKP